MKKGLIIGLVASASLCIVFAIAVAAVGIQLDEARIKNDELGSELDKARKQASLLRSERDLLKKSQDSIQEEQGSLRTQTTEQLKAIEQLKAELERVRNNHKAQEPSSVAPEQALVQ